MQLFFGGNGIAKEGLQTVKILDRDESSRLTACHCRQAGNDRGDDVLHCRQAGNDRGDDVQARYVMYD